MLGVTSLFDWLSEDIPYLSLLDRWDPSGIYLDENPKLKAWLEDTPPSMFSLEVIFLNKVYPNLLAN